MPQTAEPITPATDAQPDAESADTLDATTQLTALGAQLAAARADLAAAREALGASERRRQIERALSEADTLDVEAAALLTEAAVASMSEPDVPAAVADLQRTRPHLFRQRTSLGGAMSEHIDPPGAIDQAARAAGTGDKRALLRYLRLRRAAG